MGGDLSGVWLRLVGRFAIFRSGRLAPAATVGSRKARTLLALLAVRHTRLVTIDLIVEALWGDRLPRRPEAGVATLVSRLRATIGADTILGDRYGYQLGAATRVDLHEAASLTMEAEARLLAGRPALSLPFARRGLELLDIGSVLTDHPAAVWAEPARATHTDLLRRARHAGAEAALLTAEPIRARQLATAAITADTLDETAHRLLMRAHAAAGEPGRALMVYHALRITLATDLGIDPAPPTRDLYQAILRQSAEPA